MQTDNHSQPLSGRVAVITGGSRGFGRAMARAFAEAGASVVLAARDPEALERVHAELPHCERHLHVLTDVANAASVDALEARVLDHYGRCDILVNNAGINVRKPLEEFTVDEWKGVFATNVFGTMLCSRAFMGEMVKQAWGRIINFGSIMAHVALPGRTAYCASKAAVLGFTRSLALELAPHSITVNAISPGPFGTEMNTTLMADPVLNAQFISKIPVGRWGKPEEIGALALFLVSDAAAFITGTDILIDGGWTAQ